MLWPTTVILLPCLGILVSTLLVNNHRPIWLPIALTLASVVAGTVYFWSGIHQTCQIAESECIGATAMAWISAALWGLFAIIFIARLTVIKRKQ